MSNCFNESGKDGGGVKVAKETSALAAAQKIEEVGGPQNSGGFNEHGVKSPAQIHIKSNKEGSVQLDTKE